MLLAVQLVYSEISLLSPQDSVYVWFMLSHHEFIGEYLSNDRYTKWGPQSPVLLGSVSILQAGSNLSPKIGNTEKVLTLENTFLSKEYIFNSKLVDDASVGPGLTIQKIPLGFVTQDHLLNVLGVAKALDMRSRI